MESLRKPYIGLWNIVRFNWHFYVLAFAVLAALAVGVGFLPAPYALWGSIALLLALGSTLLSLAVSHLIYDRSGLYQLHWLDEAGMAAPQNMLNIHAGFDETSALLAQKYPRANLRVFDFYDPQKHTELSIRRARKAYPPYPGTQAVSTESLPLEAASLNSIFTLLSAHEVRDDEERIRFFSELKRALKADGKLVVTEHLRDAANFLAFNIGFFHFHSRKNWLRTFESAGLQVEKELKITPFISTFILSKNGTSP